MKKGIVLGSNDQFYTSFTDILALLLVFFIYLTSMSALHSNELKSNQGSAQSGGLHKDDFKPIEMVDSTKDLASLILKVEDNIQFPIGSSDLNDSAKLSLNELAKVIQGKPIRLLISGHSDPLPIQRKIIESNWHLSALRSASVSHYLQQQGVASNQLAIAAYGHTRPMANSVYAMQRRVEIQVEELVQ